MIREVIMPKDKEYLLKIPQEYINQKIEILIKPLSNKKSKDLDIFDKTKGILNKNLDPLEWQKSIRDEWN